MDLGYRLDLGNVVGGIVEKSISIFDSLHGGCRHNKRDKNYS